MKRAILITGATDGIGKELVKTAAQKGFEITAHGRNDKKLALLRDEILSQNSDAVMHLLKADYTNLSQTAETFKNYKKEHGMPDVLINNAGLISDKKVLTKDNFELTFQVNHLAPFLITYILAEGCSFDKRHRIINVSSMIHASEIDFGNLNAEKYFTPQQSYGLSKLCNILFTHKLNRRYENTKLLPASVHPGVINTKLLRNQWGGGASPAEGAQNVFFAVDFEGLESIPGAYIENRRPMQAADVAYDEEIQDKLWNLSTEMTKKFLK